MKSINSTFMIVVLQLMINLSLLLNQTLPTYGQESEQERQDELVSCNCVAFRLDDIQDFFLTNAQMEIVTTFEERNASLTIGVIGNAFGDDRLMLSFLNEKIESNNESISVIEVANHGWNHEDFTSFNKEGQSFLMRQSNNKIMATLGIKPIVFIPPYNNLDNDTIAAMRENGFQYVSGNTTSYPPSLLQAYQNNPLGGNGSGISKSSNTTIFHFPSSAYTGDLNGDNTEWLGYSHDRTFADIKASMSELGYAVVTMHPMEFSVRDGTLYQNKVDDVQIQELELLIEDIRDAGFKIVTISQINEGYGSVIPEFSSYSIFAILTISVVMTIWLSNKSNLSHRRQF